MKCISVPRSGIKPALLVLLAAVALSAEAQGRKGYRYAVNRYPAYGQRVARIPGPFININFGGNPYYYADGIYYRPNGGYFQVAFPPPGLRVNMLPSGYFPFYTGGYPYYYSNGIFYRNNNRSRDYEVIDAPVGAEVPALPSDARTMVIDGEKFYSVNGTYFKDEVKPNGELWYRVVGRNGVLNTNKNQRVYSQQQYPQQQSYPQSYPQPQYPQQAPQSYPQQVPQSYPQQQQPNPQPAPQSYPQQQYPQEPQQEIRQQPPLQPDVPVSIENATRTQPLTPAPSNNGGVREAVRRSNQPGQPQEPAYDSADYTAPDLITHDNPGIGWIVDKLPQNSKPVTISNKKYFLAPNGIYYEEYIDQKRQIRYKVAGKENQ